jgi:hypothetical protein
MARGAGGGTYVGSSQGMDERDVGENVARPGVQVAVKVHACLGEVWGAGLLDKRPTRRSHLLPIGSRHIYSVLLSTLLATLNKLGGLPFSARGEPQDAHEFAQNFRCLVMAALHETAGPVAS